MKAFEQVFENKSIWELLGLILKRWYIVLLVMVVGVGLMVIKTKKTTATFRTKVVLSPSKVDRPTGFFPIKLIDNPKAQLDTFLGQVSMELVMEILKSRDTMTWVINDLDLVSHYGYKGEKAPIFAIERLDKMTSMQLGLDSIVLYLYVEDISPGMTQKIAESYIRAINARNSDLQLSSDSSIVRVISSPFIPSSRFKPNLKINVIFGAAASGAFAVVIVLLLAVIAAQRAINREGVSDA